MGVQEWGQELPQGADSSTGILELQHCPRAVLTVAPGPKVTFVSLLCCHRHHVAVCPAALKMALPPPSSWVFHPPRAVARVRRGLSPGQRGSAGTEAGPPCAPCQDRRVTTAWHRSCHCPGQPVPLLSPGSVSPGFGAQDEFTSHAPPSEAPPPLWCWPALRDL